MIYRAAAALCLLFALVATPVAEAACSGTVLQRREIRDLSDKERQDFFDAVKSLQRRQGQGPSKFDDFSRIHYEARGTAHGFPWFLSWHRCFLRQFEIELQKLNSNIALPYWAWSYDSQAPAKSPIFHADWYGGNGQGSDRCVTDGQFADWRPYYPNPHCLRRDWNGGDSIGAFHAPELIDTIVSGSNTFEIFRRELEGAPHGTVHVNIGADMSTMYSPNDPIFYLHHTYIDKIWADWQAANPRNLLSYSGVDADRSAAVLEDVLEPWTLTVRDILDTKNICYTYAQFNPISNLPPAPTNVTETPIPVITATPTETPAETPTETPAGTPTETPAQEPTEAPAGTTTNSGGAEPTSSPTQTSGEGSSVSTTETPTSTDNGSTEPTDSPTSTNNAGTEPTTATPDNGENGDTNSPSSTQTDGVGTGPTTSPPSTGDGSGDGAETPSPESTENTSTEPTGLPIESTPSNDNGNGDNSASTPTSTDGGAVEPVEGENGNNTLHTDVVAQPTILPPKPGNAMPEILQPPGSTILIPEVIPISPPANDKTELVAIRHCKPLPDSWLRMNNQDIQEVRKEENRLNNITEALNKDPDYVSPAALVQRDDLLAATVADNPNANYTATIGRRRRSIATRNRSGRAQDIQKVLVDSVAARATGKALQSIRSKVRTRTNSIVNSFNNARNRVQAFVANKRISWGLR